MVHLQTALVMAKNDIWKDSAEIRALQATNAALKQKYARLQVELDLERWDKAQMIASLQGQLDYAWAWYQDAEARVSCHANL